MIVNALLLFIVGLIMLSLTSYLLFASDNTSSYTEADLQMQLAKQLITRISKLKCLNEQDLENLNTNLLQVGLFLEFEAIDNHHDFTLHGLNAETWERELKQNQLNKLDLRKLKLNRYVTRLLWKYEIKNIFYRIFNF